MVTRSGKVANKTPPISRGSSPTRIISKSRAASETGSVERLDVDNNLQRIITSFNQTEDNINVVVRVRPLNIREKKSNDTAIVQFPGSGQILIEGRPGGPSGDHKPKLFSYNVVFEPAAIQEDVLQFSGMKRLISMAVEGFRCTCFCYGQTGSGKTHTLTGPPGLFGVRTAPFSDKHGLVFRSFLYLFEVIQTKIDVNFVLKASYFEIYNEKVIDLLNPGGARKPLAVRWSKKSRGFFVENLFTVDCEEFDDLIAVLEEGLRNRSVGKHNMNEFSSRSHTILTVYITSEEPAEGGVFISRTGKINFVDLAGSEMTKKTQSEGKTLEEANNINKSLMVLGYCISSLSDSKRRSSHIPYRDSKLTKLLADSLAGNGVTLMIACISPAKSNLSETLNTLRYAARAKKIRTKPVVIMDPREALILSLKREVSVLLNENEHLRAALHVYTSGDSLEELRAAATPPPVDLERLAELDGAQLAALVRLYAAENGALRRDNTDLFTTRESLQRDHEMVCRENERLSRKLEEISTSPLLASARTSYSTEAINTLDSSDTIEWPKNEHRKMNNAAKNSNIPSCIQKGLNKLELIAINPDKTSRHRRNKSWDDQSNRKSKEFRVRSSESDGVNSKPNLAIKQKPPKMQKSKSKITPKPSPSNEQRRFSRAQSPNRKDFAGQGVNNKQKTVDVGRNRNNKSTGTENSEVFGSVVTDVTADHIGAGR